jgi:hypothetical protein
MCSQAAAKEKVREAQGRNYCWPSTAPHPSEDAESSGRERMGKSSISGVSTRQGGARNYIDPSPYGTPALLSESSSTGNFS